MKNSRTENSPQVHCGGGGTEYIVTWLNNIVLLGLRHLRIRKKMSINYSHHLETWHLAGGHWCSLGNSPWKFDHNVPQRTDLNSKQQKKGL